MSSLLDNNILPLWAWILVVVVGSIFVLGTVAILVRLLVVRRRQAQFTDTFGDDNLTRRVTVRRGRVVEQSKYLSLTGSKFGLNAFGPEDGTDTGSRAGARSKSPFEWWSTVKEQSQSCSSQITQMTYTNETTSIYGLPTSPTSQKVYQRKDINYSNASLASSSKEEEAYVSVTEQPSSPTSPTLPVRNFSRSFSRQGSHSPFSHHQRTLSRIEESSPHTSLISTRQSRVASYASNKRDTKTSPPSSLPYPPAQVTEFSQPLQWDQSSNHVSSKASSVIYLDHHEDKRLLSSPIQIPQPTAQNTNSISWTERDSRLSQPSSRQSSVSAKSAHRQSQITALPEPPTQPTMSSEYWEQRSDLTPVRSNSMGKKGRVLRKKSLKRAEMVTSVG